MKEKMRKIKNIMFYAGLRKEEYLHIRRKVNQRNYNALKISSCLGTMLLGILFLVTYTSSTLEHNRMLYGVFFLIMAAIYIITKVFFNNRSHAILPIFYLFLITAYAFGMILGVVFTKDIPATTFCVLLFALPLMIIDRPIRVAISLVFVSVVFCILSKDIKIAEAAALDVTNCICFLFLAITVNTFIIGFKARESMNSAYIERERDTDDLTKLLTKAASIREINQFFEDGIDRAALLIIDIDNFKTVNDSMGHAYGDMVIKIMGDCIKYAFRQSDIASRFGGDEFVIFLPGATDNDIVVNRVEALIEQMNTEFSSGNNKLEITGSIGIAIYPDDAMTYEELFNKADQALYESKRKGKNCYNFYISKEYLDNLQ